jgi:hypothetical protein
MAFGPLVIGKNGLSKSRVPIIAVSIISIRCYRWGSMLSELALLIRSNGVCSKCSSNWPDHMSFLSFVWLFVSTESLNGTMGKMMPRIPTIVFVGCVKAGFVSIGVGHDLMVLFFG